MMLTALDVFWYRLTHSRAWGWAKAGGRVIWRIVRPPDGYHVRRFLAWYLIGFAIIRLLNLLSWPRPMEWLPMGLYVGLKLFIGMALLLTNGSRRLTPVGYGVAVLSTAFCAMTAADSLPYINVMWVYLMPLWASLGEAGSHREYL